MTSTSTGKAANRIVQAIQKEVARASACKSRQRDRRANLTKRERAELAKMVSKVSRPPQIKGFAAVLMHPKDAAATATPSALKNAAWLGKPGGRVRCDKSTVFADGLNYPNGSITWRDGALLTAEPEIFSARPQRRRPDRRAPHARERFAG